MRVRKTETDSSGRGVARAALEGASREELLREALWALARGGNADRIGVWLKARPGMGLHGEVPAGFHGLVWDRENAETPKEWSNLSVEPHLPEELLFRGKSVEQDLEDTPDQPIIGALVELRRAFWIPIEKEAQLKGVILAGTKGSSLCFRARARNRLPRNWPWRWELRRNRETPASGARISASSGVSSRRRQPALLWRHCYRTWPTVVRIRARAETASARSSS